MNNEKPYFLKRIAAYLIDMIIVSLLATLLSLVFIKNQQTTEYTKELLTLRDAYNNKEITEEEYKAKSDDLLYTNAKETVGTTIIISGVSLVYYVIMCYFCNGITLGKFLMKVQIVGKDGKKLTMLNYLIRALLVNSILSYVISVTLVCTLSKDAYLSISTITSNVLTIFLLVSLVCIMYRQDGRGLHDIVSGTIVISTKVPKELKENKEEVVEAKVIEEKKTSKKDEVKKEVKEKKTQKKTTKKSTKKTGGNK